MALWKIIPLLFYAHITICSSAKPDFESDCEIDKSKRDVPSLIAGISSVYFICITCAIILLIYLYRFYQASDDPNIENRHPRLVYASVITVIFTNIVLFPLAIDFWTLECVTHTTWLRSNESNQPIEMFLIISFVSVILGWLILVVLRVWLLRYDYGYSLAQKHQIWKKDLGIDGGSSTWWIINRLKWGNETFLLRIFALPYLLSVILCVLLSPIGQNIHSMTAWTAMTWTVGIISIILCTFIIVNVWKVRDIHDNFQIKHEVLLFAKCSVVIAVILVIMFGISRGVNDSIIETYIVLVWGLLVMFLLTTVSWIQTGWVLRGIYQKNIRSATLISTINNEWESNITLSAVLQSKEGFEVFMDFLVAEYSTENLLMYVEATQFLRKWKFVIYQMKVLQAENENENGEIMQDAMNYVQKQMEKESDIDWTIIDRQPWFFEDKETILIKFQWVKVCNNKWHRIILSECVVCFLKQPPVMKDGDMRIWQHFKYLQEKYISSTASHQVNIRSALYRHYKKIQMDECDLSKCDLSELFRDCNNQKTMSPKNSPQLTPEPPVSPESPRSLSIPATLSLSTEETSLQPGQQKEEPNAIRSKSSPRESSYIQRMETSQWNRNLRNLHGVAKIMQLIEDTRKELWKNMNDSFVRFRSTEIYVDYIKQMYMDKKNGISVSKDRTPIDRQSKEYAFDVDGD